MNCAMPSAADGDRAPGSKPDSPRNPAAGAADTLQRAAAPRSGTARPGATNAGNGRWATNDPDRALARVRREAVVLRALVTLFLGVASVTQLCVRPPNGTAGRSAVSRSG